MIFWKGLSYFGLISKGRYQYVGQCLNEMVEIKEPKPRLISAAPYRDRIVHHALCNIIVPIFERTFVVESYANRIGFGSHRALRRFTKFARSNRYILQCDIQKYFPSIDHAILKSLLRRKIKCRDTILLIVY